MITTLYASIKHLIVGDNTRASINNPCLSYMKKKRDIRTNKNVNEGERIVCKIDKSYTGIARELKNNFDSFVGFLHVFVIKKESLLLQ